MIIYPYKRYRNIADMEGVTKCKRYIFFERRKISGKIIESSNIPVTIINDSEMIQKNRKTGENELVNSCNIYVGELIKVNPLEEKIDYNDIVKIVNSHYVLTFKPLGFNSDKVSFLENYSSFDQNMRYDFFKRFVNNNYGKEIEIFDPSPVYYNYIHEELSNNDASSFLKKLYYSDDGITYRLSELFDENTTMAYLNTNVTDLLSMTLEIENKIYKEVKYTPCDMISRIYTLFAHIKSDVESYNVISCNIIFTTNRKWNIRDIKFISKVYNDDINMMSKLLTQLMSDLSNRYSNYFIPELSFGYDFDLYMHFSPSNNALKLNFHDVKLKQNKTSVGLDGIIEELDTCFMSKFDEDRV